MRLLHARPDPVGHRAPGREAAEPRSDPRGHERQSLPLRSSSQYRGGDRRDGGTMSSPSFRYSRAADIDAALVQGSRSGAAFLAGGTDLLQLWKAGAIAPAEG